MFSISSSISVLSVHPLWCVYGKILSYVETLLQSSNYFHIPGISSHEDSLYVRALLITHSQPQCMCSSQGCLAVPSTLKQGLVTQPLLSDREVRVPKEKKIEDAGTESHSPGEQFHNDIMKLLWMDSSERWFAVRDTDWGLGVYGCFHIWFWNVPRD